MHGTTDRQAGDQLDDAFFRALFHSELGGIAIADLNSFSIVDINEVLLDLLGRARDEIVAIPHVWRDLTPPEFQELDERAIRQVIEKGHSDPFEKEYLCADGTRVPVRVSSSRVAGYPGKLIVFVTDISEERAAREREQAIQQRLEIAVSAADQGVWDWDLVTGEMIYSDRAKEIYGLPVDQPVSFEMVRDGTHPEDLEWTIPLLQRALDPAIRDRSSYEYRVIWPDGQERWVLAYGEPVFEGPPGAQEAVRYAGTIQDITARKTAERHQQVLVAELNHRVKNMLTIVQSIAFQTMRGESVPDRVADTFAGRLKALSSAHDILTQERWAGADLREIAVAALSPLVPDHQVRMTGEPVRLRPQAALSLSMTFHELGTNAAKYGALAASEGRVELAWTIDEGAKPDLLIRWEEKNGPRITAPTRLGFGTRMIKRVIGSEVRGDVTIDYAETGLICLIRAPVEALLA